MSAPTLRIPESVADDPSDVVDALEVASALWGKGQSEEAIRWLRRAVAAASETDDAVRAAGLAGAAADLEEAIKQPSAAPPAAPAPTESAAVAAPAESAAVAAPTESAAVAAPTESAAVAVPAVADAKAEASAELHAAPHAAVPSSIAVTASIPPVAIPRDLHEPQDAAEATVPDSPAAMSAYANGTSSYAPRPSSVPAPRSTFAKPPVIHPTHSPTALPDLPARMRVSVKTSVRDAGLLFVRALADGEEAPPGTLEAFLVREAPEASGEGKETPEGGAS